MPQKDRYHDTVIRALEKDGWRILKEQAMLTISRRHLWIDLKAEHAGQIIYVEIKGFETDYSLVDYLAATVGQCIMYEAAIDRLKLNISLYLAIPETAYAGIFSEELGKVVVRRAALRLLVFDAVQEKIIQWQI